MCCEWIVETALGNLQNELISHYQEDVDLSIDEAYFIEKGITRSFVLHNGKQITTWFSKEGDAA